MMVSSTLPDLHKSRSSLSPSHMSPSFSRSAWLRSGWEVAKQDRADWKVFYVNTLCSGAHALQGFKAKSPESLNAVKPLFKRLVMNSWIINYQHDSLPLPPFSLFIKHILPPLPTFPLCIFMVWTLSVLPAHHCAAPKLNHSVELWTLPLTSLFLLFCFL